MRDELLVPLSRPTITTTALQSFQRNAMNATSFNMNTNNNNDHHQYHHHHHHHHHRQDDIGGGSLQRALLGIANDIYYDTMLRMTTIAMIILIIL
jgi:G3E family GTPase